MVENALTIIEGVDTELVTGTLNKIAQFQTLLNKTLVNNRDYGVIPGTGTKPTLLKPGAEKINMLLGVTPEYEFLDRTSDFKSGFFSYEIKCRLLRVREVDGNVVKMPVSEGVGSCNSHEKKYRYVFVTKTQVPQDVDPATLSTKKDKWGNTKYSIENPNPADLANTVLKMAKKRAYIDATLQLAALSDIFTQDLEDLRGTAGFEDDTQAPNAPAPAQATATPPPAAPRYTEREKAPRQNNPGLLALKFGKYNGQTIAQIYHTDAGYVEWLADKAQNETVKSAANAYLKLVKSKAPAQQEIKDVTPADEGVPSDEDAPAPAWNPDDDTSLPFDI